MSGKLNSLKKKVRHLQDVPSKWKELSETYQKLGRVLKENRQFEESLEYFRNDRELCTRNEDMDGQALAIRMIGEVLAEDGKFQEALSYNRDYLKLAQDAHDTVNIQRALATLALTYISMSAHDSSHLNKALKYCNKCLEAISRIPSKEIDQKERCQMTGRALENIGRIKWRIGDLDQAETNFNEAEIRFRNYKLWSDLVRLTQSRAILWLESKADDLSKALKQTDKCLEASEKIDDSQKDEAMAEAFILQFKVNLISRNFYDAKQSLSKAKSLQKKDQYTDKYITRHLKMTLKVCRCENEIMQSNSESLLGNSHKPYEDIADALVCFEGSTEEKKKVSKIILDYYEKAFTRADNEGNTHLLPDLNMSIAKTYEDLQDYESALVYFERQLEYEVGNRRDQCITHSNIAMVKEFMDSSYSVVMESRQKWLQTAEEMQDTKLQVDALREILRYQKDKGHTSEAEETRRKLDHLGGGSEIDRESCSQGSDLSDKFSDIDLEAEMKTQGPIVAKARILKRIPADLLVKNKLGETPLMLDTKRPGNEVRIVSKIERGAPLEAEDNAGWTPLGEATAQMNISYMRILTEAGANINHRNNDNTTPLIQAAISGFLDGVEHLLDKGAKVDTRDKKGCTVLSYLKDHLMEAKKPNCAKDYKAPGVLERLETNVGRIEKMLTRLGLSTNVVLPVEEDSQEGFCSDDGDHTLTEDNYADYVRPRSRSPSPKSSPTLSPVAKSKKRKEVRLYQEAMDSFKGTSSRAAFTQITENPRVVQGGVGGAEECLDDWLVDDMKLSQKKRKRPVETSTQVNSKKSKNIENENPEPEIDLTLSPVFKPAVSMKSRLNKLKRKSNTSQPLISSLLPKSRTPSPLPGPSRVSPLPPPDVAMPAPTQSATSVTRVKISISGEMFLIPVSDQTQNVGWLAKEAAARYCRQVGSEPTLKIRTEDGAVLDLGDKLLDVIVAGDLLTGEVLHWNNKPSSDKYKDSCQEAGQPCFKNIQEKLSSISINNSLTLKMTLKPYHAEPVWNSLRGNSSLRQLTLSHCKLSDITVSHLTNVLSSIPHLSHLDLSYNLITTASLSSLSTPMKSLQSLNVSGNMLNNYSLPHLTSILENCPELTKLHVSRCNLTEVLFQQGRMDFASAARNSKLKDFNVSFNDMKCAGIEILMSCLPPGLQSFDISYCITRGSSDRLGACIDKLCSKGSPSSNIRSMKLSGLSLTDCGLGSLARTLNFCGHLTHLWLDDNSFTSQGLLRLLQTLLHESVPLTFLSCALTTAQSAFWSDKTLAGNIADTLESLLSSNCSRLELLVVPYNQECCSLLRKVWDRHHGVRSKHGKESLGNIKFSLE